MWDCPCRSPYSRPCLLVSRSVLTPATTGSAPPSPRRGSDTDSFPDSRRPVTGFSALLLPPHARPTSRNLLMTTDSLGFRSPSNTGRRRTETGVSRRSPLLGEGSPLNLPRDPPLPSPTFLFSVFSYRPVVGGSQTVAASR